MNKIVIRGEIGFWGVSSQEIIDQLNSMDGDIEVEIDSIGGSVLHGVTIFNAFYAYDRGEIHFIIVGVAASIASYIPLSGRSIKAYDNTTYMIHNASLPAFGDYRDLRKAADISEGLTSIISKAYVSKTSMSDKDVRKLMEDETFYYGSEMLDAGLVDEIMSTDSSTTKAEAYSVVLEGLKACNNAINENERDLSFEAVAKLLPDKKDVLEVIEEAVDLSAQQQRRRSLKILENGVKL